MPGPKSFTGEEMVEIYCHAGRFTLSTILDLILTHNCRAAEAGEFSQRRFLNHGVDISTLEGAAEVVAAKTDLAYRLSREHLLGRYGEYVSSLRQRLVHLLAEIEADIDFPDEDAVGGIGRELLKKSLDEIIADLEKLIGSYKIGRVVQDGYRVIILGPPNAGKSSLFNRLVRQNRALVTPIPGTTRDYLSEWIDIHGLPVELFDTAGLREGKGKIERAGIAGTRNLISRADLIIYLFDINGRPQKTPKMQIAKNQHLMIVLNKSDLAKAKSAKLQKWEALASTNIIAVSAKTGAGIDELLTAIYNVAGLSDLTESLVVTSQRHKSKMDKCLSHLRKVRKVSALPPEIISLELRQAADQIGEITGQIFTEDILDEIFSSFCIGK
jgi:tRNA modification GTPase